MFQNTYNISLTIIPFCVKKNQITSKKTTIKPTFLVYTAFVCIFAVKSTVSMQAYEEKIKILFFVREKPRRIKPTGGIKDTYEQENNSFDIRWLGNSRGQKCFSNLSC